MEKTPIVIKPVPVFIEPLEEYQSPAITPVVELISQNSPGGTVTVFANIVAHDSPATAMS